MPIVTHPSDLGPSSPRFGDGNGVMVVIPTRNEAENIVRLLRGVRAILPAIFCVVVDDESTDGTQEMVEDFAMCAGQTTLLRRRGPPGLGAAYVHGFRWALAQPGISWVVQMDADLSHRPCDLPVLLSAVADVDLVLGSRYVAGGGVEGWAAHRRLLSRGGNIYARALLREVRPFRDVTGGFKVWRHSALARLPLHSVTNQGYAFQVEMTVLAVRADLRVVEAPIRFPDRVAGVSKLDWSICGDAARGLLRLRG